MFADEQLQMVWGHARIGLLMATAFALLLALYLQGQVPAAGLGAWVAAKLGVAGVRLLQSRAFARGAFGAGWRHATHGLLALDGLVWGVAGAWLTGGDTTMASLVTAALACISCIATFGLQISRWATASYVCPMLLPTAGGLLWRADEFGLLGGLGVLMLLALLLATSSQSQRRLAEGFLLRRQAQDLAREKNEALNLALRQSAVKSQFLGNVSHELRTPLHGMLGLVRLLSQELPAGASQRRLALIDASGRHLLSLITDLLEVARGETDRPTLQVQPFDLAELLEQLGALHAMRAEDRGLTLVVEQGLPAPAWVLGDGRRVTQVLHNLLGNAIKFTDHGQVHLKVWREATAGAAVCFEVRDDGPGIAKADLERIFEAFARAEQPGDPPREGTGLGLKIARELARAMGGDVVVDSRPGEGACFRFTAQLPPARPPAAAPPPAEPLARAPAVLVRKRVLLAEDDEVNALIATACLEQLGLEVARVSDGRAAVRAALNGPLRPDLVLMDCRMPQLDGYGATREIRSQEYALGWARVPVIALTATVTDLGRAQCMEAGMDDFIAKPFAMDELAAAVRAWLSAAPTEAHASALAHGSLRSP